MKKTMFPVLMIMVLMVYTPAVNAGLAGSTILSISLANYDPDPAIAGGTVEVRLGIENIGGMTANNLMLEIVPSYPFELVPGENAVQSIGIIQGYQADSTENIKILKYRMQINKDALAGRYELKVKYYEQGSTDVTQKSLSLDVKSRESAEVIHIDKTMLVPGKQSSLKFTINNVGNAPLRDLTFNWENDDKIILPVGSDNTKYIKYIDIGNGTDLEYQVIADTNAQPGLYKLNLYLTYENSISNQTKKISTFAGVYVGGGTDFDVAFSDNANSQMSFSVANIGSNPDYTVASFKLQSSMSSTMMSQNRTGRRNTSIQERSMQRNSSSDAVLMQIAYTDTMGERKVVEKEVKIGLQNIVSADGQTGLQGRRGAVYQANVFSTYIWYFLGITVFVGGVVVHRKYKSRKMINPDFKIKDLFKSEKK